MRKRTTAFLGRHPLFLAALVTVVCVLLASRGLTVAIVAAFLLGALATYFRHWKTGLSWLVCGCVASCVYGWRVSSTRIAEDGLLSSPAGEMRGRVLKDAKSGGIVWRAPAVLLDGPHAGFKVWWEGRGELPVSGAVVKARGNFRPLPVTRNPGEFDQAAWLRSQGIAVSFLAGWVEGKVETGWWARLGSDARKGFRAAVTDGIPENSEEAAVIRAVVLGEPPSDADELVAAFRNSGTLHAFSVSGLHVAMVGTIGWFILRILGVSRRRAVVVLLPLIFGYSWITGNSAPAVRSAWMAAVFLGAFVSRRRPDLLNSLGAVLLTVMLWDGRLLFLPGVQLSYGVVAAIAVGAERATSWFSWLAKPELYLPVGLMNGWQTASLWTRRQIAQSLGVSVAASVGSTPLTAYHFGLVTPVSILAGVLFVPLVFFLLGIALFSAAVHPVCPPVSRLANSVNFYFAKGCVLTAEGFSSIPGGHLQTNREDEPFLLVYDLDYGAGAVCFSGGEGGAVLIDCADPYAFKRRVAPSLKRLGVEPDSVIITHPDGGHLGGGSPVWKTFPIRQALLPVEKSRSPAFKAWAIDAKRDGIKIIQAATVDGLQLPDGAKLEILHVPPSRSANSSADERCAIYRIQWHGWKILLTGDAGMGTEMDLLDSKRDISADVIISGKHRSDLNLSDRFLDAVQPEAIVSSHSDFPASERLKPETEAYWQSRGIAVVNQKKAGGVTLRMDPSGGLRVEGFADGTVKVFKRR